MKEVMRKSALLVLVFIMALSAFSIGAGDSESESEEVKEFIVKAVHYVVTTEDEVDGCKEFLHPM